LFDVRTGTTTPQVYHVAVVFRDSGGVIREINLQNRAINYYFTLKSDFEYEISNDPEIDQGSERFGFIKVIIN